MVAKGIEHNTMIKKHKDTIRIVVVKDIVNLKPNPQIFCLCLALLMCAMSLVIGLIINYDDIRAFITFALLFFLWAFHYFVVANMSEYYGKEL